MGDVRSSAQVVNSFATHILIAEVAMYGPETSLPGVPTRSGITTVQPRSTTSFAKRVTAGVIPGISWITITAGPLPRRYVSRV